MTNDDPSATPAPTDDDWIEIDEEFLIELQAGRPAPPSFYEVVDFTCELREDGFWTSASIINRFDRRWAFDLEFIVTDASGEELNQRTLAGWIAPGATVSGEIPWGLEGFDESSPCVLNVNHATILALQDEATVEEVRAVLDSEA